MLSDDAQRELSRLTDCAWVAAAFAACQRPGLLPDIRRAAEDVLIRSGLSVSALPDPEFASAVVSQLRQAAEFSARGDRTWREMDEDVLIAQGNGSRSVAEWLVDHVVPDLGMGDRIRAADARFLDAGVGTGQLAAAFAARVPGIRVTGLDIVPKALEIAQRMVATEGCDDRVELRECDIATLDERDRYDLAWLPAHYINATAVEMALPRILRALRPGGWLVAATIGATADLPIQLALIRLNAVINGGCAITQAELMPWLSDAGYAGVRPLPSVQLAGALTGARRPLEGRAQG